MVLLYLLAVGMVRGTEDGRFSLRAISQQVYVSITHRLHQVSQFKAVLSVSLNCPNITFTL